ncbi:MAG TPA: ATP-binding protein, partial [Caldimonas sp.]|nr:ATP-binding protein [Caldimonas sp.]
TLLALGVAAGCAQAAAPPPDAILRIDHAWAVAGSDGRFPGNRPADIVPLPDDWSVSRPGYEGSVWYRIAFSVNRPNLTDELAAIYVERACSNLQVLLNGQLIFVGGRMVEPVTRNCSRPQLVTLPPALLRAKDNIVDIRVEGHALERVASRENAAGLSVIEIGNQAELRRLHAPRVLWGVTWVDASSLALIGLGCVLLAVGWLNRREVYFFYFGWLTLGWVAWSLIDSARDLPWSNEVTEFLLCASWSVMLALALQFFLTFAGRRSRAIESLSALQWVVMPVSLVVAGPSRLFDVARLWYALLALELVGVMGIYLAITFRQRRQDFLPMLVVVAISIVLLGLELGVQAGWVARPAVSAPEVIVPLLLVAVGTRLFLMFARALRTTQDDRNRIAGELHRLNAEIESRVEHLTVERVGQFTEMERRRIASDLHDDLGAKLLTIVHTTDSTRMPQLAREALEEMRLSVRGLAGKAVRLDDAIADWRAETMVRLDQSHIAGKWDGVAMADPPTLSARVHMQLTRVLREAVSNVIKHSGATQCQVRCAVEGGSLVVTLRDNGRGIDGDINTGNGMSTMKRRAKGMNGQCLVESRPGHGVVISLTVPL